MLKAAQKSELPLANNHQQKNDYIVIKEYCKEQVHKFKRVIKSPTWRKIDEYPTD